MRRVAVILVATVLLIATGCSTNAEKVNDAEKAISVSVTDVQRTSIQKVQTVTGKVKPVKDINIVPKLPGTVSKVSVSLGDEVKEGQTLFTIDDKDIKLQVSQAEAALSAAKANLERTKGGSLELQQAQLDSAFKTAEINFNDAKKAYEDTKVLYDNGSVSKQNLDSLESMFKMAQEQYNTAKKAKELTEVKINKESLLAAEAQVKQAQAAYDLAASQLGNTVVKSPVDGIVSVFNAKEGEIISNAMPAASVVDISSIIIDVNVMENTVNKLKVGDSYDILINAVRTEPFEGKVLSISPNADARTQAYLVRIEAANPHKEIKGGMIAEVKMITEAKDNVIAVPLECVVNEGGRKVVYLSEGDMAVIKDVELGMQGEKYVEVIGDIKEGDRVIVKGQNFVKDQSKITVVD
jgi:multidrug efflux pump subunit AcrA (membrane-fusion protein)